MTFAAFEPTLRLCLNGRTEERPTFSMLNSDPDDMKRQAVKFKKKLLDLFGKTRLSAVYLDVVLVKDTVGGGSFPGSELPGYAVSLKLPEMGSSGKLSEKLRLLTIPVIAGVSDDKILFHVRTLSEKDEKAILNGFKEMFSLNKEKA